MKYVLGTKQEFFDFLNSITKEDKIGVITHTDLDGMASAIFLEKILESKDLKLNVLEFISYKKGMFEGPIRNLKSKGVTKLFLTDMNADESDLEAFEDLRKEFDVFLIDHHPISSDLKDKKKIIKSDTSDCSGLVLFDLGKECFNTKEWEWLVCATIISDWSFRNPENLKFLQERFPNLTLENLDESEPKILSDKIGSAITYYKGDLRKIFNLLKEKKLEDFEKPYEVIEKELKENVERFKREAEYYPDKGLYFAYFTPAFPMISPIVTQISKQDPEHTYVFAADSKDNLIKISARNQSGKEDVNLLMKKGIQGLKQATGGGHLRASAASIRKQDLEKFKENMLK